MKNGYRGCILVAPLLGACGDGEGTVRVTAYGEPFIEEGISASDMGDGWAVRFERFEVFIRDVRVAGAGVSVPARVNVAEASGGAGHELGVVEAPVDRRHRARDRRCDHLDPLDLGADRLGVLIGEVTGVG